MRLVELHKCNTLIRVLRQCKTVQFLTVSRVFVFLSVRDDEQKYQEFMKDVTSDILQRGIFTNRFGESVHFSLPHLLLRHLPAVVIDIT